MRLTTFVEKWMHPDYPPTRVSESDLSAVERQFGRRLPDEYRNTVLGTGLLSPTIALLDAIVERDLDLHAIGDFYSPSEIIEATTSWRELGMPSHLIAFASDGGGNMFCFDNAPEDTTVWFYDHDFNSSEVVAPDFGAWIDAYCDVTPVR